MGVEIERKFLVRGDGWRQGAIGVLFRQGYLASDVACSVRIRVFGDRAALTVKGAAKGLTRPEFEYEIPTADAQAMLALCRGGLVEKTRYRVHYGQSAGRGGHVWEVDEFHGDNQGLILAEIELTEEDELFERPDWLGAEVSHDPRYVNARLADHPFNQWR